MIKPRLTGARVFTLIIALAVMLCEIAGQPASARPPKAGEPKKVSVAAAVDRTAEQGTGAVSASNTAGRRTGTIESHPVRPLVEPAKQPSVPTRFHPLVPPRVVELSAPNAGPTARDRVLQGAELTKKVRTAAAHASRAQRSTAGERATKQSSITAAAEAPLRGVQVSPADNAVSQGTTPTLKAKIAEPVAGESYVYQFTVTRIETSLHGELPRTYAGATPARNWAQINCSP